MRITHYPYLLTAQERSFAEKLQDLRASALSTALQAEAGQYLHQVIMKHLTPKGLKHLGLCLPNLERRINDEIHKAHPIPHAQAAKAARERQARAKPLPKGREASGAAPKASVRHHAKTHAPRKSPVNESRY